MVLTRAADRGLLRADIVVGHDETAGSYAYAAPATAAVAAESTATGITMSRRRAPPRAARCLPRRAPAVSHSTWHEAGLSRRENIIRGVSLPPDGPDCQVTWASDLLMTADAMPMRFPFDLGAFSSERPAKLLVSYLVP